MDPRFPRCRNSRAQFKQIRNRRNRQAWKEVLAVINKLLDQVTESLANLPPDFPTSTSPSHVSFSISEERFPYSSRLDTIQYFLHYLLPYPHFLQSATHLSRLTTLIPRCFSHISLAFVTMHPERASFLNQKLTVLCARYIAIIRKLTETTNAPEQSRTPPIGISFGEAPASHYPRRVGKTSDGQNRGTPEIFEHAIFTI